MIRKGKLSIILLGLLFFCSLSKLQAQFDGHYSLSHLTKTFYNPAAIGTQDMMKVQAAQRLQTVEIKNAPVTTFFTLNTPFKINKTSHAAGIEFINDMFGIFSNQQINVQYAYQFNFKKFTISLGTNIGMMNITCFGDSIRMVESEYHTPSNNDPAMPTGTQSGMGFDLGLGAYLFGDNWNVGTAIKHIPASRVKLGDRYSFKTTQLLTIIGGYSFTLPQKNFCIEPTAVIYTDFKSWQVQVTGLLKYKDKYWGGLAYSYQNAVSIMFGTEIINGLNLAYCYDIPASQLIKVTHGSHEISLAYEFDILRNKTNNKHKSIRIL